MTVTLITGETQSLVEAWLGRCCAARLDAPLAPKLAVAPNHLIGRDLLARAAEQWGGWANLRVMTFEELTARLAATPLAAAGRAALGPLARRIALAALLKKIRLEYFAPLAGQQGFLEALDAVFQDLEEAGFARYPETPAGAVLPAKEKDLRRLYDAFRAAVEPTHFTTLDVFEAAQSQADQVSRILGAPDLAFIGFADLNRAQRRLMAALAQAMELTLYVPFVRGEAAEHARPLIEFARDALQARVQELAIEIPEQPSALDLARERFFNESDAQSQPGPAVPNFDETLKIISAPDDVREAREVVREVLSAAADGIKFCDIAVTYQGEENKRLLSDEFAAAGVPSESMVPLFVDGGVPAITTPEGLALARLGAVAAGRWLRTEVMSLLRLCPPREMKGPDGKLCPVDEAAWDQLTRIYKIVEGPDGWDLRLSEIIKLVGEKNDDVAQREFRAAWQIRQRLQPLLDLRRSIDQNAPVIEIWEHLREAAQTLVPDGEPRRDFLARLKDLESDTLVNELISPPEIPTISRAIAEGLSLSGERFRDGAVTLIPLFRLRHLSFRLVIITGLLESQIPMRGRQEPFLLDAERRRINEHYGEARLPLKGDRYREQVFLFAQALKAAREKVTLTYPRAQRSDGRQRVVSHFLVRLAEGLTGRFGEKAITTSPFYRRFTADLYAARDLALYLNPREMELAAISRSISQEPTAINSGPTAAFAGLLGLPEVIPGLLARRRTRLEKLLTPGKLSEYDGLLGAELAEGLKGFADLTDKEISATRLETYAACPRKYFLKFVMELEPLTEPAEALRLDALERGDLVHHVLRAAFEDAKRRRLLPLDERKIAEVLKLMTGELDDYARDLQTRGGLGRPLLWRLDREIILRDFRGQLADELEQAGGFAPMAFEVRFGHRAREHGPESGLSTDRPAVLVLAGHRRLLFRGKIDRIDASPDRQLRVIDYKTGKAYKVKDQPLMGGESLQLPVYLLAADQIFPDSAQAGISACYYHNTQREDFQRPGLTGGEWENLRGPFMQIVEHILDGMAAGEFFPNTAGKRTKDHCAYCEYLPYCGPQIAAQVERKQTDARFDGFAKMKESA